MAWLEMGLAAARKQANQNQEGLFLNQLGILWLILGDTGRAADYFQQVLGVDQSLNNYSDIAMTIINIATSYYISGGKKLAYDILSHVEINSRKVGDIPSLATAINNIGVLLVEFGENDKALCRFEEALNLRKGLGDLKGEAEILNNISILHDKNENFEDSIIVLKQAINIAQETRIIFNESLYHYNLGVQLQKLGKFDEAIIHVDQGLANLIKYNLPQDAGGGTLAQYESFLAELHSQRKSTAIVNDEQAILQQLIGLLYGQLGEEKFKALLQEQNISDEQIVEIIAFISQSNTGE